MNCWRCITYNCVSDIKATGNIKVQDGTWHYTFHKATVFAELQHWWSIPCGYCCPCGVYGAICWPPGGTIPGCAPILYGCIWDGGASGCWYPLWVAIGEWLIRVGPLPSDWPLEGRGGIGMFCWPANTQYDTILWRQSFRDAEKHSAPSLHRVTASCARHGPINYLPVVNPLQPDGEVIGEGYEIKYCIYLHKQRRQDWLQN